MSLLACGRTSLLSDAPCDEVQCPSGFECDPADGVCKAPPEPDGGSGNRDGGSDAGVDAGFDGGSDAGVDAGFDAGTDAGVDAGFDGGFVPCPNGCPGTQFCDETANNGLGACVNCTATKGCSGATPVCDLMEAGGQCVGCLSDSNCKSPGAPFCNPKTRQCVACAVDAHCTQPTPVCDVAANACVGCLSDLNCPAWQPVCDPSAKSCVGCLSDAHCANPLPICDLKASQCGPCTNNAQCGPGSTCSSSGQCSTLPDTCATAQPIVFPMGSNTVTFQANTAVASNDEVGTCNPAGGRELVYKLSLSQAQNVTITAVRAPGTNANAVIYLRSGLCSGGSQIACSNNSVLGMESINLLNQPAGDYYLFVEGVGNAVGPTNVTVTLGTPVTTPANDTCTGAEVLTFSGGVASASGTTVGATNGNPMGASTPVCSNSARQTGNDVVYQFTLSQPQDVTVKVVATGPNPTFRPAVYVRGPSSTNACGSDTQLACDSVGNGPITPVLLRLGNLAAGTYYVWVDSVLQTSGPFQLDVTLSAPTTNDSCAAPTSLIFVNGVATANGDTRFAYNDNQGFDAAPTCSNSAKTVGRDLVYSYTLTSAQDVTVTVTPTGTGATFQPVLYVRSPNNCTNATSSAELGCAANFSPGPQTLTFFNQPAGTYFVWVDSAQQTEGPFSLTVNLSTPVPPPTNDTCPGTALSFSGGVATTIGSTINGTNNNFVNDAVPTCSISARQTGKDVIFNYTLTQARDVTISVTSATPGYFPVFYVKKAACGSFAIGDELACENPGMSGTASTQLLNQPAGTYWIWVDSLNATPGNFTLTVQHSPPTPPPPNDTCAGAQSLTFVNDVATTAGDTTTAGNSNAASDASPTCNTTAKQKGRDLVYKYSLTSPRDVTVTVTPTGPSSTYIPVVYVRGPGTNLCTSISAGAEQACQSAGTLGQPVTAVMTNQAAGDYFLFVDGAQETFGAFSLSVTQSGPTAVPTNDSCASPATLTVGTTVSGTTALATDNYSAFSTPAYPMTCTQFGQNQGPDVVYQFTATSTSHTVTLTPAMSFDSVLAILQPMCSPASCTNYADSIGVGVPETVTFAAVPGQSYFVVVDGFASGVSGPYTLLVQ